MKINRRNLLLGLGAVGLGSMTKPRISLGASSSRPLKILVLGGTGFIGPHVVRHALSRGHEITLFNRGKTNTDLFPEARKLVGDRDGQLDALNTGEWDAVLDNSGYVPRHVKDSAELLKGRVGRYLFTSTVAVYDFDKPDIPMRPPIAGRHGSALAVLTEPDSEDVSKHYGALKVVCERYVGQAYGQDSTIVRPTYVAGPGDRTQRYTWWVERINRGGDIIVPGNADSSFAIIDVRDLAEFYIHLLETDQAGIFNASGPAGVLSYNGMLEGIRATTSSPVRFHHIDADFLEAQGVDGRELPMWTPEFRFQGEFIENQSSIEAGLKFRPLAETAVDTHEWHQSLTPEQQEFTRAGLATDKEVKVLAAWRERA